MHTVRQAKKDDAFLMQKSLGGRYDRRDRNNKHVPGMNKPRVAYSVHLLNMANFGIVLPSDLVQRFSAPYTVLVKGRGGKELVFVSLKVSGKYLRVRPWHLD